MREKIPLRIGQKATRTGTLLIGLRDPRIAAHLEPYGFSEAVIEEGWGLFLKATGHRLSRDLSKTPKTPSVVTSIDEFEDHWFPIVKIVLTRHHPQAAEELFLNLARTDGKPATYSVAIFLERLAAMEQGAEPFNQSGPEVREYLRTRGLTDEVIAEVSGDMDRLQRMAEEPAPVPVVDPEELKAADEAMWQWYLEWSAICRRVISDGNQLRALGFKKRKAPRSSSEAASDDQDLAEEVEDAALPELPRLALPAE